jgi:hypothetical protein
MTMVSEPRYRPCYFEIRHTYRTSVRALKARWWRRTGAVVEMAGHKLQSNQWLGNRSLLGPRCPGETCKLEIGIETHGTVANGYGPGRTQNVGLHYYYIGPGQAGLSVILSWMTGVLDKTGQECGAGSQHKTRDLGRTNVFRISKETIKGTS